MAADSLVRRHGGCLLQPHKNRQYPATYAGTILPFRKPGRFRGGNRH